VSNGFFHLVLGQNQSSITDVTDELPSASELFETLTFQAGFNTNTVIAGATMLGLAAGVVGVFALLRKRSLMADALSHATLPGICLAFIAATKLGMEGKSLPVLLLGATLTGVVGVLCIHAIVRFTRLHQDAAIGIVLSVFFGAGVVLLSYIQNDKASSAAGLNTFIYGQAAAMSAGDTALMAGVALASVIVAALFLKEFSLVCFNDSFARVDGWPVSFIDLLMMALVVIVTVVGLQAVGLILVVAMLIIPPVSARFWTDRLWLLVLLAGMIGALSGYAGSVVSSLLPRKPAGSVIVLTSGAVFLVSMLTAPKRGVLASALRRVLLQLQIASEHLLEAAYEHQGTSIPRSEIAKLARLRAWPGWFAPLLIWLMSRQGYLGPRTAQDVGVTPKGLTHGARVNRNHRLWEQYLVSYADIAPNHVDWSVDQVEHVLTPELVAELEELLSRQGIKVPSL
jgi:manganese/zinc/iron transport system permease protein